MTQPRSSQILRLLWLAVVLATHVCAAWLAPQVDVWLGAGDGYFETSLWIADWMLLAFWLSLGPGQWFLRLPAVGALLWLMVLWTMRRVSDADVATWELASFFVLPVGPALAARACGYRVERTGNLTHSRPRPIQFSLRAILLLTTLAAVAVKGGQWVHQHYHDRAEDSVPTYAIVILPMALAAWWAIRSALGLGKPIWRLLILAFVAPPLGLVAPLLANGYVDPAEGAHFFVLMMIVQTAIVCATALAVRVGGYRLSKGPPIWRKWRRRNAALVEGTNGAPA